MSQAKKIPTILLIEPPEISKDFNLSHQSFVKAFVPYGTKKGVYEQMQF